MYIPIVLILSIVVAVVVVWAVLLVCRPQINRELVLAEIKKRSKPCTWNVKREKMEREDLKWWKVWEWHTKTRFGVGYKHYFDFSLFVIIVLLLVGCAQLWNLRQSATASLVKNIEVCNITEHGLITALHETGEDREGHKVLFFSSTVVYIVVLVMTFFFQLYSFIHARRASCAVRGSRAVLLHGLPEMVTDASKIEAWADEIMALQEGGDDIDLNEPLHHDRPLIGVSIAFHTDGMSKTFQELTHWLVESFDDRHGLSKGNKWHLGRWFPSLKPTSTVPELLEEAYRAPWKSFALDELDPWIGMVTRLDTSQPKFITPEFSEKELDPFPILTEELQSLRGTGSAVLVFSSHAYALKFKHKLNELNSDCPVIFQNAKLSRLEWELWGRMYSDVDFRSIYRRAIISSGGEYHAVPQVLTKTKLMNLPTDAKTHGRFSPDSQRNWYPIASMCKMTPECMLWDNFSTHYSYISKAKRAAPAMFIFIITIIGFLFVPYISFFKNKGAAYISGGGLSVLLQMNVASLGTIIVYSFIMILARELSGSFYPTDTVREEGFCMVVQIVCGAFMNLLYCGIVFYEVAVSQQKQDLLESQTLTSFYNAFGRQFFELLIPFFFPLVQCFELVKSHGFNHLNIFMAMRMKLTRKSVKDAVKFPVMTVYDDYVNTIVFIMLILTIVMVHSESNPHLIFVFTGILVCFHVYRAVFWAWRSTPQHLNSSWHFRCVLGLWSVLPLSVLGMVMVQWGWICFFGGVSLYWLPGSDEAPSPMIVQCVAFICCSVVNVGFFYLALAISRMWVVDSSNKKDAVADGCDPASFFNTNLPLVVMTRCVVVNDANLLDRLPRHVREEIDKERENLSTASKGEKVEFAWNLMHPYLRGKEYQQPQWFSLSKRKGYFRGSQRFFEHPEA